MVVREAKAVSSASLRNDKQKGLILKRESHAARWGLMRGYSGKTTKWVDFVRAGSTQRKREEPCPNEKNSGWFGWASSLLFPGEPTGSLPQGGLKSLYFVAVAGFSEP